MSTGQPNIAVSSNIWICIEDPDGLDNNPAAASKTMPGDLAFKVLIPSADTRVVGQALDNGTITEKQVREREFLRHFAPHNHAEERRITG